ncbi:hypothetical protein QZH41_019879, partial [Actinostola sp. cb2023]
MSSPTRQVSVRRLPPLPNQVQIKPILKENSTNVDDGLLNKSRSSRGLSEQQVKDYLTANPNVLDELVLEIASCEQIERWLIRKAHQSRCDGSSSDNVNVSLSRWKFCVHSDKRKMLQQLTKDINQQPQKARVMNELVKSIAAATHSDRHSLYLVDKNGTDIFLYSESKPSGPNWKPLSKLSRCRTLCRQAIGKGATVSAYVAESGENVFVKDILGDERFPKGIGFEDSTAQSVLCQPIIQSDGILVGIVELVKSLGSTPFQKEDEEILNSYLVWGSIAIHHAEISKQIQKQKDLNSFLLNVVRSIFDEICTMDVVIEKIMAFAKRLVNADRCALFMLDTKTNELFANLFDEGDEDGTGYKFRNGREIRFAVTKGIAGYVASKGIIQNIRDAYRDPRFNREVDMTTGYTTRNILCVPVRCKGSIIGVVQMVNSYRGFFSSEDAEAFEMFAGYCGLALHYSKIYNCLAHAQQKHQVALEVLSYHCGGQDKEIQETSMNAHLVIIPQAFYSWEFDVYQDNDLLTHYFITMTDNFFEACQVRVDFDTIVRFTLMVRKSYRQIAYHNWAHAFSVAHSIYILLRKDESFSPLEKLFLYIAGICHDVDHRGKSNAFMIHCNTPLANLYTTSTMEWHHFHQGIFILERDGHNVFGNLNSEDYRRVLEGIQEAILATDLATFMKNRNELEKIYQDNSFSWKNEEHRSVYYWYIITIIIISITIISHHHHHPSSPSVIITISHHHHQSSSPSPPSSINHHHHRHHHPSSIITIIITSITPTIINHHHQSSSPSVIITITTIIHQSSSPSPPSSIIHHHHHPSSPSVIITIIHHHHQSSSPSSIITIIHHHHQSSSPSSIITISHHHHHPSSSIITISHHHHHPSSPSSIITISHHHHHPSSPSVIITIIHHHHHPSSPSVIITIIHHHHRHHHPSSIITIIHHHHQSSSPSSIITIATIIHHPSSPSSIITISHHHHHPSSPSPPSSIIHHHHHPSSPSVIITIIHHHHQSSSPSVIITIIHHHHHPSSPSVIITNIHHRHQSLVRRLVMTACDLCTSAKPWHIQKMAVKKVFEEFYLQIIIAIINTITIIIIIITIITTTIIIIYIIITIINTITIIIIIIITIINTTIIIIVITITIINTIINTTIIIIVITITIINTTTIIIVITIISTTIIIIYIIITIINTITIIIIIIINTTIIIIVITIIIINTIINTTTIIIVITITIINTIINTTIIIIVITITIINTIINTTIIIIVITITIINTITIGDEEKQRGVDPLPMMDRSKNKELPQNQVTS